MSLLYQLHHKDPLCIGTYKEVWQLPVLPQPASISYHGNSIKDERKSLGLMHVKYHLSSQHQIWELNDN